MLTPTPGFGAWPMSPHGSDSRGIASESRGPHDPRSKIETRGFLTVARAHRILDSFPAVSGHEGGKVIGRAGPARELVDTLVRPTLVDISRKLADAIRQCDYDGLKAIFNSAKGATDTETMYKEEFLAACPPRLIELLRTTHEQAKELESRWASDRKSEVPPLIKNLQRALESCNEAIRPYILPVQ